MNETFIKEIMVFCGITWDSEDTKGQIVSIMDDGIEEFKDWFGEDINVEKPGNIRKLFKNYCKYGYYDQLEDFKRNYQSDILRERLRYEVKFHEEKKDN